MKSKPHVYGDVAPAVPLKPKNRQLYTYDLLSTGGQVPQLYGRVKIPFGGRYVTGTLMEIHDKPVAYPIKKITSLFPIKLTEQQIAFAQWIAKTFQGGLGFTLRLFYPPLVSAWSKPLSLREKRGRKKLEIATSSTVVYVEHDIRKRARMLVTTVAALLKSGHQIMIIVPEKWMIERLINLFPVRLAPYVAAVHAERKPREITAVWTALYAGKPRVVVGTQKALFLPYRRLSLIVIEEEQLATHKLWDQYPRLHNVYAAQELAALHKAQIMYTTSFPSLRLQDTIAQEKLVEAGNNAYIPRISIIAVTFRDRERRLPLPEAFAHTLRQWVKQKQRILLFHNRRGSWQAALCRQCHSTVRCPQCDVSVVVHAGSGHKSTAWQIRCHHCGWQGKFPETCPNCRQRNVVPVGMGTEKVAATLENLIGRSIVQLDADTREKIKNSNDRFKDAQIIVATSALFTAAPELTFDRIAWLFPERSLLYPDIRSEERAFGILARLQQFYSSSSRRNIVLVTREPQVIEQTVALSPAQFAERQLKQRKRLGYPPFRDLIRLTTAEKSIKQAESKARAVRTKIEERLSAHKKDFSYPVTLRGPFQSFIKRRKGKAEAHLLLLGKLSELTSLYENLPIDVVDLDPERIL